MIFRVNNYWMIPDDSAAWAALRIFVFRFTSLKIRFTSLKNGVKLERWTLGISLGPGGGDRRVDLKRKHIDYFQSISASQRGLKNCFGIRIQGDCCWAVIQVDDEAPSTFGRPYRLPLHIEYLPIHMRMIVNDHLLNHPKSDLVEVLTGEKSFDKALDLLTTMGLGRTHAKRAEPSS